MSSSTSCQKNLVALNTGGLASAPVPWEGTGWQEGVASSVYHDSVPSNISSPEMVGMGTECENTGWTVQAVCPECGHHVELTKNTCGRVECPRCYRTWARRASQRSAARLQGFRHAGGTSYAPRHFVLEGQGLDWSAYKRTALQLGCTGGLIVLHPYRIKKNYQRMFDLESARTGINRYDLVRQSALGKDALEFSPHAHVIGYGRLRDIAPNGTFQYRMLRKLPDQAAIERTAYYLFSHALLPTEGQKGVKYFGCCSYNKLMPSWQGTCHDNLRCDQCGATMLNENSLLFGIKEVVLITKYIALGWHIRTHGHP